jgi:hypothetical protein
MEPSRTTPEKVKGMSSQELFVQQFARLFHHYRETLNAEAEGATETAQSSWIAIPFEERHRMFGAARLALLELETNSDHEDAPRKYFAKPGEADWGC